MFKNIILVGKTGSGKSTLANVLTNTNGFAESAGSVSKTREIQSKIFKENGIDYQLIDTVGFGDTSLSKDEVLDKIAEAVYLARAGIHQIFFVIDGRFDPFEILIYRILSTVVFDEKSLDFTLIVRTRSNDISTEEDSIKDVESIKASSEELARIIESCRERFIHVNNPPLYSSNSQNPELEEKVGRLRRFQSRNKIISFLLSISEQEDYIPENLQKLSSSIVGLMLLKEKYKKELNNLERKESFKGVRLSLRRCSLGSRSIMSTVSLPVSMIGAEVRRVELEELISGYEEKIREKVFFHIFNNCRPTNSLDEEVLINKLDNEINQWIKLPFFTENDYGFCAWLKKIKKKTLEFMKIEDSREIEYLRSEYDGYLEREHEICQSYAEFQKKMLSQSKISTDFNKLREEYESIFLKEKLNESKKVNWKDFWRPFNSENKKTFKEFSEEVTQNWIKNGFTKEQTKEWLELGFDYQTSYYIAWLRDEKMITIDSYKYFNYYQKEELLNQFWKRSGKVFLYCDWCRSVVEKNLMFFSNREEDKDFCSEDCQSKWKEKNEILKRQEIEKWKEHNFTFEDVQPWMKLGFRADDHKLFIDWRNHFGLVEARKWIKDLNFDKYDLKKTYYWKNNGISPNTEEELRQIKKAEIPAQKFIDTLYPQNSVCLFNYDKYSWKESNLGKSRAQITSLELGSFNLIGKLDLSDFTNLEGLCCSHNQLSSLEINNCLKLDNFYASNNQLTEIILPINNQLRWIDINDNLLTAFNYQALNSKTLINLELANNNLEATDIAVFSHLINLQSLWIGNGIERWSLNGNDKKIKTGVYNCFYGSLEAFKDCTKLRELKVDNTDINEGLEYLSEDVYDFSCSFKERPTAKCRKVGAEWRENKSQWRILRQNEELYKLIRSQFTYESFQIELEKRNAIVGNNDFSYFSRRRCKRRFDASSLDSQLSDRERLIEQFKQLEDQLQSQNFDFNFIEFEEVQKKFLQLGKELKVESNEIVELEFQLLIYSIKNSF